MRGVWNMERFSAEDYIEYVVSTKKVKYDDIKVGELVILTWFESVIDHLKNKYAAVEPKHNIFGNRNKVYNGKVNGKLVTFVYCTIGASATVAIMEELKVLGAKKIIGVGLCGSLNEKLKIGNLFIPYKCIREEGTSYHYLDANEEAIPSEVLMKKIEKAMKKNRHTYYIGNHWTTDAIYREDIEKIQKYKKEDIYGVDMETSAMYVFGIVKDIEVCNLLVVSDEMWDKWKPGFGEDKIESGFYRAMEAIEDVIIDWLF